MTDERTAWIAWGAAISAMAGTAYMALVAFDFGYGTPALLLILTASGLVFIASALHVRRRFGGLALAGWWLVGPPVLALAQGGIVADKLHLWDYTAGTLVLFLLLAPSFVPAAATLHLLAGRKVRPALQRDVPVALAVFAIAEAFNIVGVLIFTVMSIG